MKQVGFLYKISAIAAFATLAACASNNLEDAPKAPPAAKVGPKEIPEALRRAAYDAPDFGNDLPPSMLPPAPAIRREAPTETAQNGSIYVDPTTVPVPPQRARKSYQPQVDLAEFDPAITTPGRAPRATPTRGPAVSAPTPSAYGAVPPAPAAITASSASTPEPRTQSVMATATATPATGGFGLHMASYRNPQNVSKGWSELQGMHSGMLRGLQARGHAVNIPGQGQFVRLIVGPFRTPDDARRLCSELKSRDEYCKVIPFDGRPVS